MDVSDLDPIVQKLFSAGLALSTQRTYRSGNSRYERFCSEYNVQAYPTSEKTLTHFVAVLYRDGLAASTVKSYLAAVRYNQIALGLGDPRVGDMPHLEYVVKGFKKSGPSRSSRARLPITPSILRKLRTVWQKRPNPYEASMLWAISCLCFFGFLRTGEAVAPSDKNFDPNVHLSYTDVMVDNREKPQYITVRIKASKTDPFRKGTRIYLGATGTDLCPVAAILDYMVRRGNHPGPMFQFQDHRPLTRARLVTELREALHTSGYDSHNYAGHSYRIGAATTAALCGIQDSTIKMLGRWQSSAYTLYIQTPPSSLIPLSKRLVSSARN